uniref:Glycinamide ribonucleotide synthetase n=1 Tax=Steinernema glaseri TaxID=37863 RepID=A0A1I7YHP0_9BILA
LAAGGYPGDYAKGAPISGLDAAAKLTGKVFHAGTALKDGQVVTSGGRVLCATALGETVEAAQQQAYRLAAEIEWDGSFYRTDIGYRAIARERGEHQEIAIGLTVSLLTLLCLFPATADSGSGWSVLLDDQANLQLSDIRSERYRN